MVAIKDDRLPSADTAPLDTSLWTHLDKLGAPLGERCECIEASTGDNTGSVYLPHLNYNSQKNVLVRD